MLIIKTTKFKIKGTLRAVLRGTNRGVHTHFHAG